MLEVQERASNDKCIVLLKEKKSSLMNLVDSLMERDVRGNAPLLFKELTVNLKYYYQISKKLQSDSLMSTQCKSILPFVEKLEVIISNLGAMNNVLIDKLIRSTQ